MEDRTWPSLPAMFWDMVDRHGGKPFLWAKREGVYRPISWAEARGRVSALARGLRKLGIERGDRVALISENRPEWTLADLAIMAAGAISVPGYVTSTVEDHRHIFANSGAKALIVSTPSLAHRVMLAADQVSSIQSIITMEPVTTGQTSHIEVYHWDAVLLRDAQGDDDIKALIQELVPDDIACLSYTSGTGGVPKGVMTTHANIFANCHGARRLLEEIGLGEEVFLCFLPLSHSYEHTGGQMFPISLGAQIYFAESAETLAANMIEARPTIMTAVPRLYEALHQRITRALEREGGMRARLFALALRLGTKRLADPGSLTLLERLQDLVVDRLVRRKVRARFGGRLVAACSGGARLEPDVGRFFLALGLLVMQGYGQTEAGPVISANPPDAIRIDSVGRVLQGVELRLAEDGEILVRGDLVMAGYWGLPDATAMAIRDGWLHTGDIGTVDDDGYLRITDRKKDMIVLSGGENVSPAKIEGMLMAQPEISQAVLAGDGRSSLTALVVPADGHDDVSAALAVSRVNLRLSVTERIRKHAVVAPFTVENGLLTPTQKIRRLLVTQRVRTHATVTVIAMESSSDTIAKSSGTMNT